MTGARRCGRRVVAAALLTLVAACASPSAEDSTEVPAGASEASPSTADGGVGASEAKERGVFVNAYDARLDLVERSASGAVLRVTNVGKEPDRYLLSVDPVGAGQVTPAEIELGPGDQATVSVELTAPATVRMTSTGRGDEVAAVDVP